MASLTDNPALTASRRSVWRDQSLLNRAYRTAKRQGDFGAALKYAKMGDGMGLAIGRPVRSEEMEAVGNERFATDMRISGRQAPSGGLDGFDFRHSRDGGPGVGGYSFEQRGRQRPSLASYLPGTGMTAGGDSQGPPTPAGMAEPDLLPPATNAGPVAAAPDISDFRRRYMEAMDSGDEEGADGIIGEASEAGVPLSDYGKRRLNSYMNRYRPRGLRSYLT